MGGKVQSEVAREAAVGKRYRLALFDPLEGEPVRYVGREYGSSEYDRDMMQAIIQRYNETVAGDPRCYLALSAFPVDSGLLSGRLG